MNLKLTFCGVLLSLGVAFSAQAQEKTRIGAFFAYGTEIENIGIGANAEFPIMENLTISPSLIYYFPKEEYSVKVNWFEVNANANYYFVNQNNMSVYALGGLNYNSVKVSFDDAWLGDHSASDGRFGLNLGGGVNFKIDGKITPFAELKYVIIDGGQLVAGAGVKFNL
ncbi:outer membrane protein X [Mesonia hippocampi]|uniref:Outer membrane protein X n=1 Tax=Mesonia hippocampi TaxID=1628250 RepID=A0A840EWA0_9FLAO|nr:outer membrane beta-barrel protein [Mesonia hippocampi]MBB4119836.1 outer membrane protein X [Mesonia hippocampi]